MRGFFSISRIKRGEMPKGVGVCRDNSPEHSSRVEVSTRIGSGVLKDMVRFSAIPSVQKTFDVEAIF